MTQITINNALWPEKYRPRTIEDCILPSKLKKNFLDMIQSGQMANLLLTGPTGTGKTTVARALCEQLGYEYVVINGSLNGNIDTLRNEIQQYASTVSMFGNSRKVVILDEADYLSNATQPALRNFMEEYSNCGFILTCNFPNRIIDPLKSRCATVDFTFPVSEKTTLLRETIVRLTDILNKENVKFDIKVVASLANQMFPNIRKIINELQKYGATGEITSDVLSQKSDLADIIKILKTKDFKEMRTWVGENADIDFPMFVHDLYSSFSKSIDERKVPNLVLILADYDYKHTFVSNREVNMAAMLLTIMSECV